MATRKTNTAQLNPEEKAHPTTSEKFNIHYKNSGMQSISNIKIEKRKDPPKAANDPTFNVSVTSIERDDSVDIKKVKAISDNLSKKDLKARAKALRVSWFIVGWHSAVWPTQIIFGIINTITFGVMAAGSEIANEGTFFSWATKAVSGLMEFITGYSITDGVEVLFYVSYIVVLTIGLISLLVAFFQYKSAWLNPLSGTQSSLKLSTFLFVIIAYSLSFLPIINLIPWVGVWALVVLKYPK